MIYLLISIETAKVIKNCLQWADVLEKNLSNNIQFDLFITKTFKTNKTFLYAPLNLATARFMPAFRLFQLTSLVLGLKTCCCLFFFHSIKKMYLCARFSVEKCASNAIYSVEKCARFSNYSVEKRAILCLNARLTMSCLNCTSRWQCGTRRRTADTTHVSCLLPDRNVIGCRT